MKNRIVPCLVTTFIITFLYGCSVPEPVRKIDNYLQGLNSENQFSGVVLIAKDGDPRAGKGPIRI